MQRTVFTASLVVLTESPEGNEIEIVNFAQQNANVINVTEMVVANNFVTGGEPVLFTRTP